MLLDSPHVGVDLHHPFRASVSLTPEI